MISKYNDFLLENEFKEILNDIFLIIESDGIWTSPDTIEWDMTKKPDEKKPDLIDRGLDKLKRFISKLDKDQIKIYWTRLINKLKPLPEKMRKFLITHYTSVFLTTVSLTYLMSGQNETSEDGIRPVNSETIDPKIAKEIVELHKMSSFDGAQSAVKEVEAGYSDDRGDTGNWVEVPGYGRRFVGTNHGISAPILQQHLGRIPKREDMEKLSYQTALEIYKKDYWDVQNLSYLCNQSVANVIYDGCVNQGIDGMSEVIRNAAKEQDINLTGNVYSKSNLRRLNSLNQNILFNSIKKFRESRYKQAATWGRHGKGWLNRLDGIKYQINNQS